AYDVLTPGETVTLSYDPGTGNLSYDGATQFFALGTGSVGHHEPFENILADAQTNFHGSTEALIELETLRSGDIILTSSLNIKGHIESGTHLVQAIGITVNTSPGEVIVPVPVSGDFTATVPLQNGDNLLRFRTEGRTGKGHRYNITNNLVNTEFLVTGEFTDPGQGDIIFQLELTWDPSAGPQPGELKLCVGEMEWGGDPPGLLFGLDGHDGNTTSPYGTQLIVEPNRQVYIVHSNDVRPDDHNFIHWQIHRADDTGGQSMLQTYTIKWWWINPVDGPPDSTEGGQLNFGDSLNTPNYSKSFADRPSVAWTAARSFGIR
nr:hypothetical protein [bacterium]